MSYADWWAVWFFALGGVVCCRSVVGASMTARTSRFRVKLVLPHGPDAHYFHPDNFAEAKQWRETLLDEIPEEVGAQVYVYVDTSLGHVRVA